MSINPDDNSTPIDCDVALKQIFEFIDRELSVEDRAAMDQHLHTCQSCFSRVEFERLLKGKVSELQDEGATPHLASRIKNLIKDFE